MGIDYDRQAKRWKRNSPKHITDFLIRSRVVGLMKKISKNKIVLDLGCGEGYVSRQLRNIPMKIIGVDSSEKMIELGRKQGGPLDIEYHVGDVRELKFLEDNSIDVCMGNLITNYFKPDELFALYSEISRVLKKNGQFVISMPHPVLYIPSIIGSKSYEVKDKDFDYVESRGKSFKIIIKTISNEEFEVGIYHSTFEDHFKALANAGLVVDMIEEPVVSNELSEKHQLFSDLEGKAPYVIMKGFKI
jgi:ubiquinone/menaquinone biosynthesis C-methylase UbiE